MSKHNGLTDISKLIDDYYAAGGEITRCETGEYALDESCFWDGWRVGNASSHEEEVENYLHGRTRDDERYWTDYRDVPIMDLLGW